MPRSRRCYEGARGREPRRRGARPSVRLRRWAAARPRAARCAARRCPEGGSAAVWRSRPEGRAASHGPRAFALDGVEYLLVSAVGEHVHRAAPAEAAFATVQPDLGALVRVEVAQSLRHVMQFEQAVAVTSAWCIASRGPVTHLAFGDPN